MRPIRSYFIASLTLLTLSASAQLQTFKGDTSSASLANRVNYGASAAGRAGAKGNTGPFNEFAYRSEVQAATNGGVKSFNSILPDANGNVVATTQNVAENVNLYYTQVRARSAVSATGAIRYDVPTGVFSFSGTKTDVGLANVDNTSDANKPISSATQTALNGKEPTLPTGTASQVIRGDKTLGTLDKTAVGLSNVDNTSDVNKPISSATQTALNGKANLANAMYRDDVADIAALQAYSVPAGKSYIIVVANDTSQAAPYNTNQPYFKDSTGLMFKFSLIKQ